MTNNVVSFPKRHNITDAVRYIEDGGLGEMLYATGVCLENWETTVACDTKIMYALCVMVNRYLNGETHGN